MTTTDQAGTPPRPVRPQYGYQQNVEYAAAGMALYVRELEAYADALAVRYDQQERRLTAIDGEIAWMISRWEAKGPMDPAQELRELRAAIAAGTS